MSTITTAGKMAQDFDVHNGRIATFDVAKALIMLLVVGGHLSGNGIVQDSNAWIDPYFGNFTVGVNMPLFFMISGFFSAGSIYNGSAGKIVARTIGLLWPVAAWGIVFGVMYGCLFAVPIWKVLLYPFARIAFGGWFLLALAFSYVLAACAMILGKTLLQRVLNLILVYIVLFFLPRSGWAYWSGKVFHMFPYFVFGMLVLRPSLIYKRTFVAISAGLFFITMLFLLGNFWENGMSFYVVACEWRSMLTNARLIVCHLLRIAIGVTGAIFVLWVIDIACTRYAWFRSLSVFGTTTLGVYVIHEWPIVKVGECDFSMLPLAGGLKWPLAILIFLLCHYLTLYIRRTRYLNLFFFGDEKRLAKLVDNVLLSINIRQ